MPENSARKSDLRQVAWANWATCRFEAAIHEAWAAYRLRPHDCDTKALLAVLLDRFPSTVAADKRSDLICLLQDQKIEPDYISTAGWCLVLRDAVWHATANNGALNKLAEHLDSDELSLTLLREAPVSHRKAERTLTSVRRWLLFSGQHQHFPRLTNALAAQATLNGGAWPFDDTERALLDRGRSLPIAAAYLPARDFPEPSAEELADRVTRAVAERYERWPHPVWQRVLVSQEARLPDVIRALDPGGPDCLPVDAKILIAGCGTGRQAVKHALKYPDAAVTAIDVSEASLHYARRKSASLSVRNVRFLNLDLHNIDDLHEQFDAIWCTGVLHHLPDPERGWAALAAVLRPGGVMKIMVYSRIARLLVAAARRLIRDLASKPLNDDVLRQARQNLMERCDCEMLQPILNSRNFDTLPGTADLLFSPHEDAFDISRISRALQHLRLRLLSFPLSTPDQTARYNATFPHDPMHRDLQSLAQFEKSEPFAFLRMYSFWCRSGDGSVNAI